MQFHEYFRDDKHYYIVTEYIDGGELFDEIQRRTKFTEDIAASVLKEILISVTYCNSKKIMHRDLKPENILVDTLEPKKLSTKVIDFGSAQYFFNKGEYQPTTGTPYYMAPEVLMNNYNEFCDVWSAGVILYIMLCGKPPFNGKTQEDIMRAVKKASINFSAPEWKDVGDSAKELIKKMIKYPPASRISVHDALFHSWMNIKNIEINQISLKNALQNLQTFHVFFFYQGM